MPRTNILVSAMVGTSAAGKMRLLVSAGLAPEALGRGGGGGAVSIRDSITDEDPPNAHQAQQGEVKAKVVKVKEVVEADVLVWIGARQRGRSSTS